MSHYSGMEGTVKTRRIVVLGGAGDMARVAVDRLVTLVEDGQFVIADLDGVKAQRVARGFASSRIEGVRADIFDRRGLSTLIEGSTLVINATGPLFRTGVPVLEACIERGVDYIDFGDTLEAADQMLALSEQAKAAGITALICAGLTPGLLGLIVAKAARELDRVEDVDIAWVSAPTPPREGVEKGGVALVEHMLHESMGKTASFCDGKRIEIPAFQQSEWVRFPKPLGTIRVYQLGHAEIATIPRFLPGVRNVRVFGGLTPAYLVGLFQGVARQVERGGVELHQAVECIAALDAGRRPRNLRPIWGILCGVGAQLLRGELCVEDVWSFLRLVLTGRIVGKYVGGVLVRVTGERSGCRVTLETAQAMELGSEDRGDGGMDVVTGTPLAVFACLLLRGSIDARGVVSPEACVDPKEFQEFFARLGIPEIDALFSLCLNRAEQDPGGTR